MAYPISALRILRGIPWDNDYVNVRKFTSKTEQQNYMMAHLAYNLGDNFSYIRKEQGEPIRVELSEGDLLNCNYLMFINAEYSDRWFFAFITDVRYVADGTSYIYFEVDEIQTWLFDFQIPACLVEREHTNDDTIGANTVDEGLDCGPYVVQSAWTHDFGGLCCIVITSDPPTDFSFSSMYNQMVNNVFNGLYIFAFDVNNNSETSGGKGLDNLKEFLEAVKTEGKESAIVSIFMAPQLSYLYVQLGGRVEPKETTSFNKPYSNIDGYSPKNKKLFTFPYNYMILDNNSGITNELRYELFDGDQIELEVVGIVGTMPEGYVGPLNYRGMSEDFSNGVVIKSFPQCAFTGDTFKAWWAQNKQSMITAMTQQKMNNQLALVQSGLGTTTGIVGSAMLGNPLGVAGNVISGVGGIASTALGNMGSLYNQGMNNLREIQHMQAMPDSARGQVQTEGLQAYMDRVGVTRYSVTIKAEYARRIDDFFSMFGYKTNRIKTPNLEGRTSWNYVKTVGAIVEGNVPISAARLLQDMLNRGVTFWHVDDVGNYGLSNPIK